MTDEPTKILKSNLINDEDNDSTRIRDGGKIYPPATSALTCDGF